MRCLACCQPPLSCVITSLVLQSQQLVRLIVIIKSPVHRVTAAVRMTGSVASLMPPVDLVMSIASATTQYCMWLFSGTGHTGQVSAHNPRRTKTMDSM